MFEKFMDLIENGEKLSQLPGRCFLFWINKPQYVTDISAIGYRWDFALVDARVLIEVQGGIWMSERTGHTSGRGVRRDCEKANLAALHGWRTLFFTPDMVESGEALRTIREVVQCHCD